MSCHHTSRPGVQSTSCPVRRTTSTFSTDGHSATASSTAGFRAIAEPRRFWPSAVMTSFALRVVDAAAQRLRGEAGEHHRVRCADARARQHRDDRLGDHRQVDRHAVPGDDAQLRQGMGRLRHLDQELCVRDVEPVAGLALEADRHLVAVAGLHVTVDAVVGDVEPTADEPRGERRLRPVEHLGERLSPGQMGRLLRPEPQPIGRSRVVQGRLRIGLAGELRRRREGAVLVAEVGQGVGSEVVVGHGASEPKHWVRWGCVGHPLGSPGRARP